VSWKLENSIRLKSDRFATLENVNDNKDINMDWENITENIQILAKRVQVCMNGSNIFHGLIRIFRFFRSKEEAKKQWVQDQN